MIWFEHQISLLHVLCQTLLSDEMHVCNYILTYIILRKSFQECFPILLGKLVLDVFFF
jgi:hypothetical protein